MSNNKLVLGLLAVALVAVVIVGSYTISTKYSSESRENTYSTRERRWGGGYGDGDNDHDWRWRDWNDDDDDNNYDNHSPFDPPAPSKGWSRWGRDHWNTHFQPNEKKITKNNVNSLVLRCQINFTRALTIEPITTGDNYLYVTCQDGGIYAFDRYTCAQLWRYNVTAFFDDKPAITCPVTVNGVNGTIPAPGSATARSSVAVDGSYIYAGTLKGAYALKINRYSGSLVSWKKLEDHCLAQITAAPVVHSGSVWYGISSGENQAGLTLSPLGYRCCTFRGSIVQLRGSDLSIISKTYTMPPNGGVAGGEAGSAVWGSAFPFDTEKGRVYMGVGNQYSHTERVELCRSMVNDPAANIAFLNNTYNLLNDVIQRDPCRAEGDLGDSITGLRSKDGVITWSSSFILTDSYNLACGLSLRHDNLFIPRIPRFCPQFPGPDQDFSQAPMFVRGSKYTPGGFDIVIAGQKTGILYCLLAESGKIAWASPIGTMGFFGGFQWGMATDGKKVYYLNTNSAKLNITIVQDGVNVTTDGPVFGAVNITSGEVLWNRASPYKGFGVGLLSVANGILYASAMSGNNTCPTCEFGGFVHFIDTDTGVIIGERDGGKGSCFGTSIVDGVLYQANGMHPWSGGRLSVYSLPNDRRF